MLYGIVEQHADAFFAHLGERDAVLPGFVRDEFDAYLRCGRLEDGFLRVKCTQCRHEHLVALVCNSNYTSCVLTVMFVLVSYK